MKGDNSIGYITSGGFAHFVNKSVAFSYLDKKNLSSEDGELNHSIKEDLKIK